MLSEHIDPITPTELFTGADTIVSGRVERVLSRSTDDEDMIMTEYQIVPFRFVKRDARLDSAATPAARTTFVVRRRAGSVMEGDVRYTTWAMA